jgi:hypothetical protein
MIQMRGITEFVILQPTELLPQEMGYLLAPQVMNHPPAERGRTHPILDREVSQLRYGCSGPSRKSHLYECSFVVIQLSNQCHSLCIGMKMVDLYSK